MRYAAIKRIDIANGPGVRVSVFVQGCDRHCPGCFNPETWDFNGGGLWCPDFDADNVLTFCKPDWIAGLSILGGEPLHIDNHAMVWDLIYRFRERFGDGKTIWLYTGYTFDELITRNYDIIMNDILPNIDVLVDGPYIEAQRNISLLWRGSENQRIIDSKKTMQKLKENPPNPQFLPIVIPDDSFNRIPYPDGKGSVKGGCYHKEEKNNG